MNLKFNEIELANGAIVQTVDLTDKQYKEILTDTLSLKRIYNNITLNEPEIIIYEINDKNILVSSDGYYSIYKNIEDLILVMNDFNNDGIEILNERNNFNQNFPSHTNVLIENIFKEINLNKVAYESYDLELFDKKIISITDSAKFKQKHLLEYIALIGEKIIRQCKGKWTMVLSNDSKTWNPYLVINNKKIDIVSYVYEDIIEKNKNAQDCYKSILDIVNYREE